MNKLFLIPRKEFDRIQKSKLQDHEKLALIADMCRANALTAVKIAGSGHLGSSFSAMDIVVLLYYQVMNTIEKGIDHPDRDIYFSSKGHDVPGLYSVLYSLNVLPKEKLLKLRRLGGLDGHPDIKIPGIECNSGSLGMGISKARGIAIAKKLAGYKGRVFVLTGDGELQEGQIFEALQTTIHQNINNLIAIVDHNKVQSDKRIKEIIDLGDIESKFREFGWYVKRCDGHDFIALESIIADFNQINDRPKILIADTIKGKGISFMEHPKALDDENGLYKWHSGAPNDETFAQGYQEFIERINGLLSESDLSPLQLEAVPSEKKVKSGVSSEYVADAFGSALVDIAKENKNIIVLDADLAADCRIRKFEEKYPDRFIENGIAEQDMVSMAGGLALQGYLPVVNSFAAFLASRANEQIYTNAGEGTKIIYVCHYAGLIPAGPGKSHQSLRDISLFGALPNFEIIQPCNAAETEMAINYCVKNTPNNCVLRLIIGPSPRIVELPDSYRFEKGKGALVREGKDGVLFCYGPVMLHEALVANEILSKRGFSLKVVNMPWLNRININWLADCIENMSSIYVLEDHAPEGGLGDYLLRTMIKEKLLGSRRYRCYAVEGFPACGTPIEALKYHGLDGASISKKNITRLLKLLNIILRVDIMPKCLICEKNYEPFLSFGKMPIANGFLSQDQFKKEYFFDLKVGFCSTCKMVQLIEQPKREMMFHGDYAFYSSTSSSMTQHFKEFADLIINKHLKSENTLAVEIGSNDGIMLQNFAKAGIRHVGIEPSENVGKVAVDKGINTIFEFFDENLAKKIIEEYGQADAIFAANVMCHIPYLHSVIPGIKILLKPDGVLMFEDPYLGDIIEKTSYDQIYDEHAFYFSVASISYLFKQYGLEIIDVLPQNVHGGSMRYVIAHEGKMKINLRVIQQQEKEKLLGLSLLETYEKFRRNVENSRNQLMELLTNIRKEGKRIVGYAATSKSTTITNYCGITPQLIEFISDTTPIKHGKYSPGAHIQVRPYQEFCDNYPEYALLFAWNHANEIMAKEKKFLESGGRWIVYVPKVEVRKNVMQ